MDMLGLVHWNSPMCFFVLFPHLEDSPSLFVPLVVVKIRSHLYQRTSEDFACCHEFSYAALELCLAYIPHMCLYMFINIY